MNGLLKVELQGPPLCSAPKKTHGPLPLTAHQTHQHTPRQREHVYQRRHTPRINGPFVWAAGLRSDECVCVCVLVRFRRRERKKEMVAWLCSLQVRAHVAVRPALCASANPSILSFMITCFFRQPHSHQGPHQQNSCPQRARCKSST